MTTIVPFMIAKIDENCMIVQNNWKFWMKLKSKKCL